VVAFVRAIPESIVELYTKSLPLSSVPALFLALKCTLKSPVSGAVVS
jgi:hypothetical protein